MTDRRALARLAIMAVVLLAGVRDLAATEYVEVPLLAEAVAAGLLPPVGERLPTEPSVVAMALPWQAPGQYGGELRMMVSQPKDTRMMIVYGYARLVGYDPEWNLVPDLLANIEVEKERVFTLHLRQGHRWSDGHPFTAEDFRFYWEDIANNDELSPGGPDRFLQVDGEPARFEVIDPTTVRYSWAKPNPFFLPALAGARPEYIFAPAHVLKTMHPRYSDPAMLKQRAKAEGQRSWTSLFNLKGQQYRNDNPDLPTLEPWALVTRPPSSRFVFARNPFYHRVDPAGRQLPYIDRVALTIVSPQLIPAKSAAGDADLQARSLGFENYTILKQSERRNNYHVRLWRSARGSELALYPDLNVEDKDWRVLLRDVRFRRALSLAINRHEINQAIYYRLAKEGNDTVLPKSPLFEEKYAQTWAGFDLAQANRLLDDLGLRARDGAGTRLMANGRPLVLVVETAGEDPNQLAILQLITDSWREVGVHLIAKAEQRDVLRSRIFAGKAVMAAWFGLENALATPMTPPGELAPTSQQQLCWPKWGQYFESSGRAGEPPEDAAAAELLELYQAWVGSTDDAVKSGIWHRMLAIRMDNVFSIGTVHSVPQPVVVSDRLRNVPAEGVYNWEPGAFFGVYHPDTFWFGDAGSSPGG